MSISIDIKSLSDHQLVHIYNEIYKERKNRYLSRIQPKKDKIVEIFELLTKNRQIRSKYTSIMINNNSDNFITFLANYLDDTTIDKWLDIEMKNDKLQWDEDETDDKIDYSQNEINFTDIDIEQIGFDFYNYTYLNNRGYEWVGGYINEFNSE